MNRNKYFKDILFTIVILLVSTGTSVLLSNRDFLDSNLILIYIFAVVLISIRTNRLNGIIASIASVFIFNFLFTAPRYTFAVADPRYILTLIIMLAVALIITTLTAREKKLAQESRRGETHANVLLNISRTLLTLSGREAICRESLEQLGQILSNGTCIRLNGTEDEEECIAGDPEIQKRRPILHVEIKGSDFSHGFLFLDNNRKQDRSLSDDEKALIQTFVALLSLALDRDLISRKHEDVKVRAEREKLRVMILRSISHDFRTPLAGIAGASTTLLENCQLLDPETQNELLKGIYDEASWLTRLVENILSLSKVQSSTGLISKTPEVLDDILYSAAQKIQKRLNAHKLVIEPPENVFLVPVDAILIEQVIINLLENAINHTQSDSTIILSSKKTARENRDFIEIAVSDNGSGIPEENLAGIFDFFKSSGKPTGKSARGSGLGLGICKAIVEAHGGTISAGNKAEGGAVFQFTLPMDQREDNS
ncbi:MAG: DUF4118 domain-containing protein [Spirochaetales bacterium]|nr:DUF4118 domain-containing protein [Spirochaetales bacterium]